MDLANMIMDIYLMLLGYNVSVVKKPKMIKVEVNQVIKVEEMVNVVDDIVEEDLITEDNIDYYLDDYHDDELGTWSDDS